MDRFRVYLLRAGLMCVFYLLWGLSGKAQFKSTDWYLSPKISFADYSDKNDWSGHSIKKIPPISVSLEKGLNDFFSVGAYLGYSRDSYKNDTIATNSHRYSNFGIGALGSIHWAGWIEKWSNYSIFLGDWDFYTSAGLVLKWKTTREKDFWNAETKAYASNDEQEVKVEVRPMVGVRYYVTDNFCMLIEVGNANLGMFTTGVSWRL